MGWETVRKQQGARGLVELRRAESGKGPGKVTAWRIFCEGVQVDYASVERDVDVNFDRAVRGEFRYEPAAPCPAGDQCTGAAFPGHPAHKEGLK